MGWVRYSGRPQMPELVYTRSWAGSQATQQPGLGQEDTLWQLGSRASNSSYPKFKVKT